MKVTVDANKQEYLLVFRQETASNGAGNLWIGTTYGASGEELWVRFYEKDGIPRNVEYSSYITTPIITLRERIQEELTINMQAQVSLIDQDEEEELPGSNMTPYDPNKIKVRRDFLSIREIFMRIEEDKSIDLNPDFQRYFVWNNTQKSSFIESLLLGLPIPLFYFAENADATFSVVDGLQRLTTIQQFMRNEFAIKGVERLDAEMYNGKYFKPDKNKDIAPDKCLPPPMARRIEGTQLVINVIEASSPLQVKFDIFQRINSGGKHLNNQEIRNCMASPAVRQALRNMVHNDLFRDVTVKSVSEQRMDDQELALRFIGFYWFKTGQVDYNGNMTLFLNNLIGILNGAKEKELRGLQERFRTSLLNCQHAFGEYAFRKCLPEHLLPNANRQLLNKSLFTTWTVALCDQDIRLSTVSGLFAQLQAKHLAENNRFYQNVTSKTNDKSVIENVFKEVETIIKIGLQRQLATP